MDERNLTYSKVLEEIEAEHQLEKMRLTKLFEIKGYLEALYDLEFEVDNETEMLTLRNMVLISVDDDETILISFSNICNPSESAIMSLRLSKKFEIEVAENFIESDGKIFFGDEADFVYNRNKMIHDLTDLSESNENLCKFVSW
jgi:hypothetical protein